MAENQYFSKRQTSYLIVIEPLSLPLLSENMVRKPRFVHVLTHYR